MKVLVFCLLLTGASVDSLDPAIEELDPLMPAISESDLESLQNLDQLAPAIVESLQNSDEPAPIKGACYTQWFDRDDPTGEGDFETLDKLRVEYPGKICKTPLSIQAKTLLGLPPLQVIQWYDTTNGFACRNDMQKKRRRCWDYKVRFLCPCIGR